MAAEVMASATPLPTLTFSNTRRISSFAFSATPLMYPKNAKSFMSTSSPKWGLGLFSPWNGLKHLGFSVRQRPAKYEKKGKCRGMVVYASLFGVGAPEALVIGVVALLVFGPKGLAEVARNLGKTLRDFQPTIRELQEVSREFKTTLEREIGLDDVPPSMNDSPASTSSTVKENPLATVDPTEDPFAAEDPESVQSTDDLLKFWAEASAKSSTTTTQETETSDSKVYSSEELLKVTEKQLAATAVQQETERPVAPQGESQAPPEVANGISPSEKLESER
ncbi:sec-independent protein translocase protein TATB, chloroplastic-like isoform X1 [Aristolochia californica]|uniref:sec-independent protein translocase protein TATB, chloroplastic-like isoform X1 n=1 Tax=Aristolochia californica TaxID=171875 RepID=UPI0035D720CE